MQKTLHILFVIIFVCFNSLLYGMKDSLEENYHENYTCSLHDWISKNNIAVVKSLLCSGGNVHERENGTTPLHRAVWYGYAEITRLLCKYKANVHQRDKYEDTPLHIAASQGHDNFIIEILLYAGANINATDKYGATPLHIASGRGCADVVELLCYHGANIAQGNKGEDTSLYIASCNGHINVVEILLQYGAKITEQIQHVAQVKGHTHLVELLQERLDQKHRSS